jgi:hypothetical protein
MKEKKEEQLALLNSDGDENIPRIKELADDIADLLKQKTGLQDLELIRKSIEQKKAYL